MDTIGRGGGQPGSPALAEWRGNQTLDTTILPRRTARRRLALALPAHGVLLRRPRIHAVITTLTERSVDRAVSAGVDTVLSARSFRRFLYPNDVGIQYYRWDCVENCYQPEFRWVRQIREKYELTNILKSMVESPQTTTASRSVSKSSRRFPWRWPFCRPRLRASYMASRKCSSLRWKTVPASKGRFNRPLSNAS